MSRVGYIKLHRKMMRSKLLKNSYTLHIWITLLLKAAHSSNKWTYNNREYSVRAGELFTCLDTLSNDTGISRSIIYQAIKKLKAEQMITTQATPYGTHIHIVKWNEYQLDNKKQARIQSRTEHIKNDNYKPLKTIKKYI